MDDDNKNEVSTITDIEANITGISKTIQMFVEGVRNISRAHIIENMINVMSEISKISKMISTVDVAAYMKSFNEAFSTFFDALEEARNNPYSYFNLKDYEKKLNDFHWAWPYGITPEEMKELLENATDELEFDKLMMSFFTKKRVNQMCEYTLLLLSRKQKKIFSQIMDAYNQGQYALINNAIFSIIDNLLSVVLKNKGRTTRKGILQPIIEYYSNNYRFADIDFIFQLQMLSNNINLIFSDYNFAETKELETHKKARRHLSAHGVKYSNRRCDSVMLLNTLTSLLDNMKYIEPFSDSLEYKNKMFCISAKKYVITNRIRKQVHIESRKKQEKIFC